MSSGAVLSEVTKERWRTASRFADVLESEVKSRRHPFVARVVSWFNFCRVCQDVEEQLLLASTLSHDERQLHAALLSSAIAGGESLLLEAVDAEDLRPLGITPEAIRAKIESLRITFEQWHTDLHPERQAAVLREVFGVSV
jgi:hypothetical protein